MDHPLVCCPSHLFLDCRGRYCSQLYVWRCRIRSPGKSGGPWWLLLSSSAIVFTSTAERGNNHINTHTMTGDTLRGCSQQRRPAGHTPAQQSRWLNTVRVWPNPWRIISAPAAAESHIYIPSCPPDSLSDCYPSLLGGPRRMKTY